MRDVLQKQLFPEILILNPYLWDYDTDHREMQSAIHQPHDIDLFFQVKEMQSYIISHP